MKDASNPLSTLSPEQQAAFLARVQSRGMIPDQSPPLLSPGGTGEPPLSAQQRSLWYLDRLIPTGAVYTITSCFRLRGPLDRTVLEQSLNALVKRHAVLRTRFSSHDGTPTQQVMPELTVPLQFEADLGAIPETEREAALYSLLAEAARRPFDLGEGPLWRVHLVRLGENDHALLFVFHHSIMDGWSLSIFLNELSLLYTSSLTGRSALLAALPLQYTDYARWQEAHHQGDRLDRLAAYWKGQLAGAPALLDLPIARARPGVQQYHGARHSFSLRASLVRRLEALGRREQVTPFVVYLAAFAVLLSRYSGQTDLTIGTPMANRTPATFEPLIGYFVNTLPLRLDLAGNPSIPTLLHQAQQVAAHAAEHSELPFEQLVQVVAPQRDPSYHAIFQTVFAFQNSPPATLELADLSAEPLAVELGTAKLDLALTLTPTVESLVGTVDFRTDLFERDDIERLTGHFFTLLEAMAREPHCPIEALPLLTAPERWQLLYERNETARTLPDQPLPLLFDAQAARTPEAPALMQGGRSLPYRTLQARANQLAHHLQRLGVGPEVCVAVCLERSIELVIGWLGILKAGGAYVPIDPDYPRERLAFMLQEVQAPVVLTQADLLPRLPSLPGTTVVCLDTGWEHLAGEPDTAPTGNTRLDELAYVIFTSGSTGQSKGVEILHRGLLNMALWHIQEFDISPKDRVTQLISPAFDAAGAEVWPALIAGACVCIPEAETRLDSVALRDWMLEHRITITILPAPLAEPLLALAWPTPCTLRLLLVGGDSLRVPLPPTLPFPVINCYGPTEASVTATAGRMFPAEQSDRWPSIGRPVANTQVYVLNEALQPVPDYVSGELYIGGDGLARGYRNRPDENAKRFIAHPFSQIPGERLYRTGDRACWQSDGSLVFGGRLDDQVKIGGVRIEPRELEGALGHHPAVGKCLVLALEVAPGDKRLVAYILPSQQEPEDNLTLQLRQFLEERLPAFMVPAAIEVLDAFPLTPNGKVDYSALPAPDWADLTQATSDPFVAPQTLVEQQLAAIWGKLLGVLQVSRHAHFFKLGGHSLLVMRVLSRIRTTFQIDLSVQDFFQTPTIAALAARIEQRQRAREGVSIPGPIPHQSRGVSSFPLTCAQEALWYIQHFAPQSGAYNVTFALRLSGALDMNSLQSSLDTLIARHEVLRTSFPSVEGTPVQVIGPAWPLSLPVINLCTMPEAEREAHAWQLIQQEAEEPFRLEQGSLLRCRLFRLTDATDAEHLLSFTTHHIIIDAWSLDILLQELATLYAALSTGHPASLPPLSIQCADYAVWERNRLQGAHLDGLLAYWRQKLDGAPALLDLQIAHPRPAILSSSGEHRSFLLSSALTRRLRERCQEAQVTPFMFLLAAFQVLLMRYTNQTDVIVGTPVTNRPLPELEPLIGYFVNTLPLRTDLSGNPHFSEVLRAVEQVCLEAFEHQELPFERLVEELAPLRDAHHHPVVQVLFGFQQAHKPIRFSGLEVQPLSVVGRSSKFDMTVQFEDGEKGLRGTVEFPTALFEVETIERWIGHFLTLLEAVAADPHQHIATLPLLTPAETQQLLFDWNDTDEPISSALVPALFEAQVARTPAETALACDNCRLSYATLEHRANQLAHLLQRLGVGPEVLVGLCVERSPELVIGLLGILKAGGAYLPLDPAYPKERLLWQLEDARCPVLLTQRSLVSRIPAGTREVICLDNPALLEQEPTNAPQIRIQPEQLAYVIYTSGSTGRPKGVEVTHRGIPNLVQAQVQAWGLGPGSQVLQFASASFDASVSEIFTALISGATLHLAGPKALLEPETLARLLKEKAITTVTLPPSLLAHLKPEEFPHLETLVVAGEACPVGLVQSWARGRRMFNAYGPTEVTVCTTMGECQADEQTPPSIGRRLKNTQVYVLDDQQQPVPIWVPGELYVGGIGLARGYRNLPELTLQRFVPHPFTPVPGARLYRTGDRVCYRADGLLEYHGRMDDQIKLRGYRIEPEEIVATLVQHPAIQQATVVAQEFRPGEKHLVAYVAAHPPVLSLISELRALIKQQLPDYMAPEAFVVLEELPLSPNGKIDRRALPAFDRIQRDAGEDVVYPRNEIEQEVTDIWTEVLGVASFSVLDNFFDDVGGHSLLVAKVRARIQERFSIDLPLRVVFESQTVETQAQVIESYLTQSESTGKEDEADGSDQQGAPPGERQAFRVEPPMPAQTAPEAGQNTTRSLFSVPPALPQAGESLSLSPTRGRAGGQASHLPRKWEFGLFLCGETISNVGNAVTAFAVPVLVYLLTGSPINLALSTAATYLPFPLFGLLIGTLADRKDRKRLMMLADFANALVIGSIPLLALLGFTAHRPLFVAYLYVAGFVSSTLGICFESGQNAAIKSLVKTRDDLVKVNGRVQASYQSAKTVGPLLAGFLILFMPVPLVLSIDAGSFLVSLCTLCLIRTSFNASGAPPEKHFRQDLIEGLHYVWHHPVLRNISLLAALLNLFLATTLSQLVLFTHQQFGVSDTAVGVMFAAGGCGTVLLALLAGRIRNRWTFSKVTLGAVIAAGFCTVALTQTHWFWLGLGLWGLASGARILFIVNTNALRQMIVPNEMLSRVSSFSMMLASSVFPVGAFCGGLLIGWIGNIALIYGGIGLLTGLIGVGFIFTSLGRAEQFLPGETWRGSRAGGKRARLSWSGWKRA